MKFLRLFFKIAAITLISIGLFSCSGSRKSSSNKEDMEMHKEMMKKHMENAQLFKVKITAMSPIKPVLKSGVFASPGKGKLGPANPAIFPGESASFSFTAPTSTLPPLGGSGEHLNMAFMFVQSNDLFFAFPQEGLDLYDDKGKPVTGDVTDQLVLYDAGTEKDTAPGTGRYQKPAQDPKAVNQGPSENENVEPVEDAKTNDFDYPDASDVVKVTIQHHGDSKFTVTVKNISKKHTIDSKRAGGTVPLSPGVWAVYEDALPFRLFKTGKPASTGLERLAEDGFPAGKHTPIQSGLAEAVAQKKGVIVPLSPPVLAVHKKGVQIFTVGKAAGPGIETLAEDGYPVAKMKGKNLPATPDQALVNILKKTDGVYSVTAKPNPHGKFPALEPKPHGPGESAVVKIKAAPGDRLFLATMYVQSNDLFYAFGDDGLALFHNGQPISGNVTNKVVLYDAGTEVDEEPGVGPNQKPRTGPKAKDVGKDEHGVIKTVVGAGENGGTNNGFKYPANAKIIRVTVSRVPVH